MRYVVNAGFCDGKPRLRVVDATSGEVRVEWFLEKSRDPVQEDATALPETCPGEQHNGMQSLLKNLFLIACRDDLELSRDDGSHGNKDNGATTKETYGVNQ